MKPFYVYLLRCGDGSYYAGHTDDLEARMTQHHDGATGYTSTRKPLELVWQGEFETRAGALAFEQQIKGWSRAKKEALIGGDWERIQELATSRSGAGLRQAQPERVGVQTERVETQPERVGAQTERAEIQPEQVGTQTERAQIQPERVGSQAERVGSQAERVGSQTERAQTQPERVGAQTERVETQTEHAQTRTERVGIQPEQVGTQSEQAGTQPERVQTHSVRPELVEGPGPARAALRQAQHDPMRALPERECVDPNAGPQHPLAEPVLRGAAAQQRRAIAKAITLLESTRADHRAQGDQLLTALLPHTGNSFRLGISGVPGVGKSTFIETLGLFLIGRGHRVAVLTVDPSSSVSGGSILGDKTRMEQLSVHEQAYIRPSPSGGTLGGVAEKTREAMLVCEAAGYDIVIVETVGVGQSETAVAGMTDMFVLMQLPNAGDDLQAIKKGVMELADLVAINKADIDPDAATRAQAQITSALRLFTQHGRERGQWQPRVTQLSALRSTGVDTFWEAVSRFREIQEAEGRLQARRRHQALAWMWERIESGLKQAFRHHAQVQALLPGLTGEVEQGRLPASTAARQLLAAFQLPH